MTNRHLTYYLISLAITLAISNNLMSKGKDFLSYFEQTSEEKFMQGSVEQRDSRFRIPKRQLTDISALSKTTTSSTSKTESQ